MTSWYEPMYPYRKGTTLLSILRDGWSRGFELSQTVDECHRMGFSTVTTDFVARVWKFHDYKYERYIEHCETARAAAHLDFNC